MSGFDGPIRSRKSLAQGTWLVILRRYLIWIVGTNLLWEVLHLPLYTVSETGTMSSIAWLLVRCTVGDVLIALSSLVLSLVLLDRRDWPARAYWRVAGLALAFGLAYTLFSEWYNTALTGAWAYSDLMPLIPVLGLGLSPVAQWIVLPLLGFWWAGRNLAEPAAKTADTAHLPHSMR
jgi:hypothetical protein